MTDGAVALNTRWLKVSPSTTVPAFAVVEVTGTSIIDDELVINVAKPSGNSLPAAKVMFISNCGIKSGEVGLGTYSFPAWAKASLSVSVGQTCGTGTNSFEMQFGQKGFYCEGADAERAIIRVKPNPAFEDDDCTPDEPIYSRRYECLDNPYYVDEDSGSYLVTEDDTTDCCDWLNPRGYLYEFLDYYEWDEDKCDWVLVPAETPNRKIMCCDPRCSTETNPESCSPCFPDTIPSGQECCGRSYEVNATFSCSDTQTIRSLPTKVWMEQVLCADASSVNCDPDSTVLIPGSEQEDAGGIANYSYTLTGPACTGSDQMYYYKVVGEVCHEPNSPSTFTSLIVLWEDCNDPDCATCPWDAAQVDHDPADFEIEGTISGNVEANVTEPFTWDETAFAWYAEFTVVAEDSLLGAAEQRTLNICVWVGCDNNAAAGSPGFGDPAGFPVYCSDCDTVVGGINFDNAVGYNNTLSITTFDGQEIIDACGGTDFTNGSTLSLNVTIGECS